MMSIGESEALARQAEADAAVKELSREASLESARLAYLRAQLADIDLALLRAPRRPQTARRVGALRQQRASVLGIVRGLAEHTSLLKAFALLLDEYSIGNQGMDLNINSPRNEGHVFHVMALEDAAHRFNVQPELAAPVAADLAPLQELRRSAECNEDPLSGRFQAPVWNPCGGAR